MPGPLQWPAGKLPPTCDHCGATLRPALAQGSLLPPGVARSRNANPARGAIVIAWCPPCSLDYVRNEAGEFEQVPVEEAVKRIPGELL